MLECLEFAFGYFFKIFTDSTPTVELVYNDMFMQILNVQSFNNQRLFYLFFQRAGFQTQQLVVKYK